MFLLRSVPYVGMNGSTMTWLEDLEAIIDDAKKRKHIIEVTRFRKTA
mgnify:FL=1|jgi:hypothetical protein